MNKLRIYQLIHRDLTGQLNHSEEAELNSYKTQNEYEHIFSELSVVWSASKNYFPQQKFDVDAAKARFTKRIAEDKAPRKGRVIAMPWMLAAAAAAAILVLVAWWSYSALPSGTKTISSGEGVEYALLPDNTETWLNTGSTLMYPAFEEGAARNLTLDGEAYFIVHSIEESPFVLELGSNNYLEVIGTAFNVKTEPGEGRAEVRVNEGVVKLYNTTVPDLAITLYPGESANIDVDRGTVVPYKHSGSYSFFSDQLNFKNAPLPEVFEKLGTFFKVKFSYDRLALNPCLVNSPLMDDFGLEEIFAVLEGLFPGLSITKSGKTSYRVSGLVCAE